MKKHKPTRNWKSVIRYHLIPISPEMKMRLFWDIQDRTVIPILFDLEQETQHYYEET